MNSLIHCVSRRTLLGAAAALGTLAATGTPARAQIDQSAYKFATWLGLVGQQVLVDGVPTYVRSVSPGIGKAFHVSMDGSALAEGLWQVSHSTFGIVDLFISVQGDHALCTFNTLVKDQ